jgi:hypothetical protein
MGLPSPHLDYNRPAAEMILSPGNNSDRVVEQARQPPRYEKREKNSSSSTSRRTDRVNSSLSPVGPLTVSARLFSLLHLPCRWFLLLLLSHSFKNKQKQNKIILFHGKPMRRNNKIRDV